MKHEQQVEILDQLIHMLDSHTNADAGVMRQNPTAGYVCPDLAKTEWETFFKNHTQLVGLSGDLPEPGTFMTLDDFGVPVLCTRDRDGKFHAFVNMCRHRGSRLVLEKKGKARNFACPFHFWGYNNQGELTSIPEQAHFGEIDKSCHGLIRLPAVEKHNMLWVHPNPKGQIDVSALLGNLESEIESWNYSQFVFMDETTIAMDLNWKLANDTFGETYHFSRLHKATLSQIFHGDALAYEAIGQNHRFVFPSRRIDKLREKPREEWSLVQGATLLYFLFPNIQFIMGRGTISLVKIYPDKDNPGRSITKIGHYFSKRLLEPKEEAAAEGKENLSPENVYDVEAQFSALPDIKATAEVFDSTVEKEDYTMGEMTQKAVEAGVLDKLIFGRNEPALHHMHNTYRAALGQPPLEEYRST
ncbi:MAG: aromatic ring-hydroxylating oxygenase subunit alpha [Alphaproteobacteria bacterium]